MSRSLAAVSALWGLSILLSRVIGVAREAAMGRILGAGAEADAYFVAFVLPDAVNYLVAGGALTLVFGPIHGRHLAAGDEGRAWESYSVIANFHLVLLGVLVAAAWLAAPALAPLIAPGFPPAQLDRLVHLVRILLPAQVFHVVGGLLGAALQTRERHSLPALAPLVYTLATIAGGLAGGASAGAAGFAWGVLGGAVAGPFAMNLAGALRQGLRWRPTLDLAHPDLRAYLVRALPIMLALSIVAVDDWILRRVGTSLGAGAVATIGYAKQLMRVPMGIFGVAAGIAAFPVLIRMTAAGDGPGAHALIARSVRQVLVLALGAQVALTAAGPEVSALVYGGRIPWERHLLVGSALGILSVGLWSWAAQNVLVRGFYARGNTWLPSVVGTAVAVAAYPLYAWAGARHGVNGLAAASAAAISVYGVAVALLVRRELGGAPAFPGFALRVAPAVLAGIGAGLAVRGPVAGLPFAARLAAPAAAGLAVYAAVALLLGVREARELAGALRRRSAGGAAPAPAPAAGGGADRRPAIRVLLTGGGTGGHVYPLLELHRQLAEEYRIERVLYLGIRGRAEDAILPRTGIPIAHVAAAPFEGRSPGRLLPAVAQTVAGTLRAMLVLLRLRPHLVLASGGYVSAPACFAAFLLRPILGTRVVVHEQNVVPGLMNKAASLFADVVLVSSPETPYFLWSARCVHTGYPVREGIAALPGREQARRELGIGAGATVLLAFGGSMGARALNRALPGAVAGVAPPPGGLVVLHATGLGTGEYRPWDDTVGRVRALLPEAPALGGEGARFGDAGGRLEYRLVPYLHRMDLALAAADLVLCRAGAGALGEVAAAGRAAVVVPKRGLPGDHQELNAIALAQGGGCLPVFERRGADGVDYVAVDELAAALRGLVADPARRAALAAGSRAAASPDSRRRFLETVRRVLAREPLEPAPTTDIPASVRIRKQVDTLVEFLRREPPGSHYRALYAIKMEEGLAAASWRRRNDAIKLAGALGRADRLPALAAIFPGGNGYMRRNVLRAFEHVGAWTPEVRAVLLAAFDDRYFEVRSLAFTLAGRFARECAADADVGAAMLRAFGRPGQHLEVRVEALRVLPLFLAGADYRRLAGPSRFAQNVRVRQAILDGLRAALRAGRFDAAEREALRTFAGEMLITTSGFSPRFHIRESFLALQAALEAGRGGEEGPR